MLLAGSHRYLLEVRNAVRAEIDPFMNDVFISQNQQTTGPYSSEELRARLADGRATSEDLVWREGMEWEALGSFLARMPGVKSQTVTPTTPLKWGSVGNVMKGVVGVLLLFIVLSKAAGLFESVLPGTPAISITEQKSEWRPVRRGFTGQEGTLWLPRLSLTVRNDGSTEIPNIRLRAVFLSEKATIVGEAETVVTALPSKRAKGPIFLQCDTGFTNDLPLALMEDDPKVRWHYELFSGPIGGEWTKIRSGEVWSSPSAAGNGL